MKGVGKIPFAGSQIDTETAQTILADLRGEANCCVEELEGGTPDPSLAMRRLRVRRERTNKSHRDCSVRTVLSG